MRLTWQDWWASRTIKLHSAFATLYMAVMPIFVMWSEDDWAEFGLSQKAVLLIVAGLNIIHTLVGGYMRKITTEPLAGRSM